MKDNNHRYSIIEPSSGLFFKGSFNGYWELSDKEYKTFNTVGACKGFLTKMRNEYNRGRRVNYHDTIDPNKLRIAEFAIVFVRTL